MRTELNFSRRLAGLALLATASLARADYDLAWYTFDGGGANSTANGYAVTGTIAQPDAGPDDGMSAGAYEIVGGFWGAAQAVACGNIAPCDVNCDGSLNGFDIQPFVLLLNNLAVPCSPCVGDVNGDGSVNGQDIQPFRDALLAGGCD